MRLVLLEQLLELFPFYYWVFFKLNVSFTVERIVEVKW